MTPDDLMQPLLVQIGQLVAERAQLLAQNREKDARIRELEAQAPATGDASGVS